jgi:hypothetical protein
MTEIRYLRRDPFDETPSQVVIKTHGYDAVRRLGEVFDDLADGRCEAVDLLGRLSALGRGVGRCVLRAVPNRLERSVRADVHGSRDVSIEWHNVREHWAKCGEAIGVMLRHDYRGVELERDPMTVAAPSASSRCR